MLCQVLYLLAGGLRLSNISARLVDPALAAAMTAGGAVTAQATHTVCVGPGCSDAGMCHVSGSMVALLCA